MNAGFDQEAMRNSPNVTSDPLTPDVAPDVPEFRVVDPPATGVSPVSPRKFLWQTVIVLASLGAGVALAWLLNRRNKVVENSESSPSIAGVPVIGSVSHAWMTNVQALHRRESLKFTGGVLCLLLLSGLVFII